MPLIATISVTQGKVVYSSSTSMFLNLTGFLHNHKCSRREGETNKNINYGGREKEKKKKSVSKSNNNTNSSRLTPPKSTYQSHLYALCLLKT